MSTVTVKVLNLHIQQRKLQKIFDLHKETMDKFNRIDDDIERAYIKDQFSKNRQVNQNIVNAFKVCYIIAYATCGATVIFSKSKMTYWPSTYNVPYEFAQKEYVYLIGLFYQATTGALCVFGLTFGDSYPIILLSMVCTHIETLRRQMRKLGHPRQGEAEPKKTENLNQNFYNEMKECLLYFEFCNR